MMAQDENSNMAEEQEVRVSVRDEVRQGSYANLALVSHSAHEFTIDFCQVQSGESSAPVQADVVARVHVAPTLVDAVVRALRSNLAAYQAAFGPIKEVQ